MFNVLLRMTDEKVEVKVKAQKDRTGTNYNATF